VNELAMQSGAVEEKISGLDEQSGKYLLKVKHSLNKNEANNQNHSRPTLYKLIY